MSQSMQSMRMSMLSNGHLKSGSCDDGSGGSERECGSQGSQGEGDGISGSVLM